MSKLAAKPMVPEAAGAENAPAESAEAAREPAPKPLSLDQLGVGATNPFLHSGERATRRSAPRSARAAGLAEFQRSIAGELARADHSAGLGPEGPVLTALEQATLAENPEPSSTALFRCRTDATGRLLSVELVQASSALEPWHEIARRVARALARETLRIPKTGYGLTFEIRVISRVQMPSGADPGLAVNVLGIPVKKGDGPRSARIDVLNIVPHVEDQTQTLPDGRTVHVPVVQIGSVLGVHLDPADLGAKPRRMVRAHVERIAANDAPRSPAVGP